MFVKSCFYETVENLRPIKERFVGKYCLVPHCSVAVMAYLRAVKADAGIEI